MKIRAVAIAFLLLAACSAEPKKDGQSALSKEPISVRGWVTDVEGAGGDGTSFKTVETENARRQQLFQAMNVWVENAPYVSGGLYENGAFLLLDVPPGTVTLTFQAPGAPAAKLVLQNIPGNADVFLPFILLKKDGVTMLQPSDVKVRMAAKIPQAKPTGRNALVNGQPVPIIETPMAEMTNRRDWPTPPGNTLATVK
jgi:hypothetical protein